MKSMICAILIIICTTWGLYGQIDRSKPPVPGPAPEIKIGDYTSFKLKNDLEVFVIENHKLPRVAIAIGFRLDPILEGTNTGYVQLAGQLLRTGTVNRSKEKLDEEVDFIGGTLITSSDFIYGASLKKHLKILVELVADVTMHPEFRQEELDKLKKQTLSGLAFSKDKPDMIANRIQDILNYGNKHPYGEILTKESVESVTLDMCNNYYEKYFSPDHAYMAVVGDVSLKEIKKLITKYFGGWKSKKVPFHQYKLPKAPEIRTVALVDRPNAVQSNILITYPVRLKLGSRNQVKVEVLNKILGGSFTGRLFMNLREDKGYTYGAYSNLEADPLVGYFSAETEVRNAVTDSAITEIFYEMNRIRTESVSEDDLRSAKNYLTGEFSRSLEDPQTIAQFILNVERYWMPKDYYNNYLKNIEAVTVEDIQAMAKKYITPDNAFVLVVGKGDDINENLKTFSANSKILYFTPEGKQYYPEAFKAPEGVTAQTIIEKHIKALGGRKNLEKVKDITIKAQTGFRGRSATIWVYKKAPNKLVQKMEFGSFARKTVYDGERAISVGSGQSIEIIGDNLEALKFEAEMNGILNLDKFWIEPVLVGEESVDEKETYKIKFKPRAGKSWFVYYDKKTGLELRRESEVDTPNGSFTQVTELDDYRQVEGLMFPFTITQYTGNRELTSNIIFININAGIDDSEFEVNF